MSGRRIFAMERAARGGFSLIEILLVLSIVGLLAGLAFVDYSGMLSYERLKQAARRIGGHCDRARAQAVALQRSCLLEIDFVHSRFRFAPDPSRDTYGRFVHPETGLEMSEDEIAEWNEAFEWEDLPRDVFFVDVEVSALEKYDERAGSIAIRYPPDGTVDPFIVHLKTGKGDQMSVSVSGLGGGAQCEPGRAAFPVAEPRDFSDIMGSHAPGTGSSKNEKKSEKPSDKKKSSKDDGRASGKDGR